MAEEEVKNSEEESFRKQRQWTSFKAQVASALSLATFFGLLGGLVPKMVELLGAPSAMAEAVSALMIDPLPAVAVAATMAVGVGITYFAQSQFTELKMLEDEHLAKRNAQCNAEEKARAKATAQAVVLEHDQNCRADGKQWSEVVGARTAAQAQAVTAVI